MDKFPRHIQNKLLTALYEVYPDPLNGTDCLDLLTEFGDFSNQIANIKYLVDHGLISENSLNKLSSSNGDTYTLCPNFMTITTKGIDFIRDDGGLSAILNVMTIKIHNETLEKLENIIKQSSLTDKEKKKFIDKLKELPAEGIKHLVFELIKLGAPQAVELFRSFF